MQHKFLLLGFIALVSACNETNKQYGRSDAPFSSTADANRNNGTNSADNGCLPYFSGTSNEVLSVTDSEGRRYSLCSILSESHAKQIVVYPVELSCGDCADNLSLLLYEIKNSSYSESTKVVAVFPQVVENNSAGGVSELIDSGLLVAFDKFEKVMPIFSNAVHRAYVATERNGYNLSATQVGQIVKTAKDLSLQSNKDVLNADFKILSIWNGTRHYAPSGITITPY